MLWCFNVCVCLEYHNRVEGKRPKLAGITNQLWKSGKGKRHVLDGITSNKRLICMFYSFWWTSWLIFCDGVCSFQLIFYACSILDVLKMVCRVGRADSELMRL
ncbi:uncharacterized protein LOC131636995 [Vicia villosa]|uniref:uncharacterized protein LOC131636995 n=1 Tax=Vicia villosa TaxID=3911 RepID=UPI00273B5753|nr:uncharacterized protein LOC131636995 [Vicia villosa]